jgi:hypothetical protein
MGTRDTTNARSGVLLMPGLPALVLAAGTGGVGGTNERCRNFALDPHNLAFLQEPPNKSVKLAGKTLHAILTRPAW